MLCQQPLPLPSVAALAGCNMAPVNNQVYLHTGEAGVVDGAAKGGGWRAVAGVWWEGEGEANANRKRPGQAPPRHPGCMLHMWHTVAVCMMLCA